MKLNVGGRIFSVTLEMMLKHPNSFFGALFSGRWEEKRGPDGSIFIDRSGTLFHHITDYLRDDVWRADLSVAELQAASTEAKFYCLEGLGIALDNLVQEKSIQASWKRIHDEIWNPLEKEGFGSF